MPTRRMGTVGFWHGNVEDLRYGFSNDYLDIVNLLSSDVGIIDNVRNALIPIS